VHHRATEDTEMELKARVGKWLGSVHYKECLLIATSTLTFSEWHPQEKSYEFLCGSVVRID
ncbi:MAG: hypothetical protein V1899_01910, partial [Planctomycetota bacterium]